MRRKKERTKLSQITDYLYISARPKPERVDEFRALDIGLIISMIGHIRPPEVFAQPPLRLLWLRTYDTIFTPIPVQKLMRGVRTALPIIEKGKPVLTYCAWGRHRSVAMGAAILIARGYSADEAMELLRRRRKVAHPQAWHIKRQIKKFERHWQRVLQMA